MKQVHEGLPEGWVLEEGGRERLAEIKPMWEKLNRHHGELNPLFRPEIEKRTFEMRMSGLLQKANTQMRVCLCRDVLRGKIAGYCVATVTGDFSEKTVGEVDSIFVEEEYRHGRQSCSFRVGAYLMELCMAWFDAEKVTERVIGVLAGNEQVLDFYRKFHFYPRSIRLSYIQPQEKDSQ